jgi:hypothetical protein
LFNDDFFTGHFIHKDLCESCEQKIMTAIFNAIKECRQ